MYHFDTFCGRFAVAGDDMAITRIWLPGSLPSESAVAPGALELRMASEIAEFLRGERRDFSVPCRPQGTVFQCAVWREMKKIPYARLATYGELARAVGRPGGARAVGMACHRNPLPLVYPCHRVVGANGALTGFGGGLKLKQVLDIERRNG